jgi:hypothetical protein
VASILRPKALRLGDCVAVGALSSRMDDVDELAIEQGVDAIRQMGFNVHVSPLLELDRHWWWSAARPQEIANELNRLLRDPEIRAIFAVVGGRTTMSYLDLIDYEAVRAEPRSLRRGDPVLGGARDVVRGDLERPPCAALRGRARSDLRHGGRDGRGREPDRGWP